MLNTTEMAALILGEGGWSRCDPLWGMRYPANDTASKHRSVKSTSTVNSLGLGILCPNCALFSKKSKTKIDLSALVAEFAALTLCGNIRKVGQDGEPRESSHIKKSTPIQNNPKRNGKRRRRFLEQDDKDESNDDAKPPGARSAGSAGSAESRGLACHYYLFDREKYRSCGLHRFRGYADVKQHILDRTHRQKPFCPICGRTFNTFDDRDAHVRGQTCQERILPVLPGVSQEQERAIRYPQTSARRTAEQKWFDVWDILFPGIPQPQTPWLTGDEDVQFFEELEQSVHADPASLQGDWQSPILADAPPDQLLPAVIEVLRRLGRIRNRRQVQRRRSRQNGQTIETHHHQSFPIRPRSNAVADRQEVRIAPFSDISTYRAAPPEPFSPQTHAYPLQFPLETLPTQHGGLNGQSRSDSTLEIPGVPIPIGYPPHELMLNSNSFPQNWQDELYQTDSYTSNYFNNDEQHPTLNSNHDLFYPGPGNMGNAAQGAPPYQDTSNPG